MSVFATCDLCPQQIPVYPCDCFVNHINNPFTNEIHGEEHPPISRAPHRCVVAIDETAETRPVFPEGSIAGEGEEVPRTTTVEPVLTRSETCIGYVACSCNTNPNVIILVMFQSLRGHYHLYKIY
jgi:hypothetical protein